MSQPVEQTLRPLGAFEQTIDLYMHRNPVQFSLIAELTRDVSESELAAALRDLQRVHPLLSAAVVRPGAGGQASFGLTDEAIPIRVAGSSTWQDQAALEQTTAIEPLPGPLVRAVLLPGRMPDTPTALLLTFAHQITDGRGALLAVTDLLGILAGRGLAPRTTPSAQEELLTADPPTPGEPPADPAPLPPSRLRPFGGSRPAVQPAALDARATEALLDRARAESCTVQAALCAAAASALFRTSADGRVRINVPIDLRSAVDLDDDVVIRFSATMVDLERVAGEPFWDLARRAHGQLDAARQPATVQATALMIAAATPATPEEAEGAMLAATGADIEITNLGVVDPSAEAEISALWGPTMTTQVDGERILGVVTSGGVLRLVNVTQDPSGDIAADVVGALAAALD